MLLQVLSDLHIEVNRGFIPQISPAADVIVLAGDVGIAGRGHLQTGLEKIRVAVTAAGSLAPVLFVPGNHEYDRQDWDIAHAQIAQLCSSYDIEFFDHGDRTIDGVRFLGVTLWSDFELFGPSMRDQAMRSAKHFLASTGSSRHGQPFTAEAVRELGIENERWLSDRLTMPVAKKLNTTAPKTVVITHFAPSSKSADPRYGLVPGTAAFCNDAEHLLPRAQLWIHGHLHCPSDYWQHGCRVFCNPLGYSKKSEQKFFKAQALVEV